MIRDRTLLSCELIQAVFRGDTVELFVSVDMVMDDSQLLPILNKIRRPDDTLSYFEMMIATNIFKDSPVPPQVVALQVHS
jgi:hypothetical protein